MSIGNPTFYDSIPLMSCLLVKSGHITIIPINNHHAFIYQDWHLLRQFPKTLYNLIVLYQAILLFFRGIFGEASLTKSAPCILGQIFQLAAPKINSSNPETCEVWGSYWKGTPHVAPGIGGETKQNMVINRVLGIILSKYGGMVTYGT